MRAVTYKHVFIRRVAGSIIHLFLSVRTVAVNKKFTFRLRCTIVLRCVRSTKNGERTETETGARKIAESAIFRRNGRPSLECGSYTRRHGSYWLFANTSRQVGP